MAKVLTILDRINNLEAAANQLQQMSDENLGQFRGALSNVVEVVAALIDVQGGSDLDNKVQAKVNERREARMAEQAKKAADVLTTLLEQGTLVPADAVTEASVITGREFDKDGEIIPPGYVQVQFSQLSESAKKALLGQTVGFTFEANGPKFELTGVYAFAPPKAPEELKAAPEPQATPEPVQAEPTPTEGQTTPTVE